MADDIAADPEARHHAPVGAKVVDSSSSAEPDPEAARPRALWKYLRDSAELLESGLAIDGSLLPERGRGLSLKAVTIKAIWWQIEDRMMIARKLGKTATTRARNLETALLASALLDEQVNPNDVTQACRGFRRNYQKR